ncbi:MAG: hypothetical protein IPN01_31715 [Deltaproteobacteria bacterium]|nr:hypothetical protein [Deltaproteobacteria bacterium]
MRDLGTIDGSGGANRGQPVTFTPDDQRLYKLTDEPTGAPTPPQDRPRLHRPLRPRRAVVARWERGGWWSSPQRDAVAFVEATRSTPAPLPLTGGQAIELNPKRRLPPSPQSRRRRGLAELDNNRRPPLV